MEAQYRDECVGCLSVCVSVASHMSVTTHPNFTEFSLHVACDSGSVFVWRGCDVLCVLSGLWMTSRVPTVDQAKAKATQTERTYLR